MSLCGTYLYCELQYCFCVLYFSNYFWYMVEILYGYISKSVERNPWKANSFSASQEYGTPRFITTFTGALHLFQYSARSVHISNPTFWRSILILSSHLRLVLPSGLFPSGSSTKILNATHLYAIRPKCFPPIQGVFKKIPNFCYKDFLAHFAAF